MVGDLVAASLDKDEIRMNAEVFAAMATTRSFLFERVYLGRLADSVQDSVDEILGALLQHHLAQADADGGPEAKQQAVDYVAGMTDRFALRAFGELTGAPAPDLGVLG
jgi:dGTPase